MIIILYGDILYSKYHIPTRKVSVFSIQCDATDVPDVLYLLEDDIYQVCLKLNDNTHPIGLRTFQSQNMLTPFFQMKTFQPQDFSAPELKTV